MVHSGAILSMTCKTLKSEKKTAHYHRDDYGNLCMLIWLVVIKKITCILYLLLGRGSGGAPPEKCILEQFSSKHGGVNKRSLGGHFDIKADFVWNLLGKKLMFWQNFCDSFFFKYRSCLIPRQLKETRYSRFLDS